MSKEERLQVEEEINNLIDLYEEKLKSLQGFNPCYTCCDLTASNTEEQSLKGFIEDLKKLI